MPVEQAGNQRLDSWKTIAAYLGRDVRTVARWEQTRGMPVRRLPGGPRSAVFAFKNEIDSWLSCPSEELGNSLLGSWKTIAAYLDRNVRTVVRWERTRGLPVHRFPGGRRSAVFACERQLDGWLSGQIVLPSAHKHP